MVTPEAVEIVEKLSEDQRGQGTDIVGRKKRRRRINLHTRGGSKSSPALEEFIHADPDIEDDSEAHSDPETSIDHHLPAIPSIPGYVDEVKSDSEMADIFDGASSPPSVQNFGSIDSDPEVKSAFTMMRQCEKKYKKTLRLSSDAIVRTLC